MLTYKKEVEGPRLEVQYDVGTESPRGYSNIGVFVWLDRNSIDPEPGTVYKEAVLDTEGQATSTENHIELMKKYLEADSDGIVEIYPVHKYEHGNIVYGLGRAFGFDYSNKGFYFVLKTKLKEVIGTDEVEPKEIERIISNELEIYSQWANGEVYIFTLFDEQGEEIKSCGGFYFLESIKEYLPNEFKDEDLQDYFKSNTDGQY